MFKLAIKRITRVGVHSWGVGLAAFLVASFALCVTQILLGMQASLHSTIDRLGADILVVPEGVAADTRGALLLGISERAWMPQEILGKIAAVPGVSRASPQLYLTTLAENDCCPDQEILLIAYDPVTDFTIRPWLKDEAQAVLKTGEAVAGSEIAAHLGTDSMGWDVIDTDIGGFPLHVNGFLEPTGTRLDSALFLSFETASELTTRSNLTISAPDGGAGVLSSVMVQLDPGTNPYEVSLEMMHAVPGINPLTSLELFQSYQRQLSSLLRSVVVVMVITLIVSSLLTALIFSMAVNERREELGVLRALGATRLAIFQSLIMEVSLLAFGGGLVGGLMTGLGLTAFRREFIDLLEIPFIQPSSQTLMLQFGLGLAAAIFLVTAAVLLPAYRISREEPAYAMRE